MMKRILFGLMAINAFGILAQVNPIELGRASNAETIMTTVTNQVYANDSVNMVGFIHQQDITVWGGVGTENGKLRYDLSIDGGMTFNNDIGVLNTTYVNFGRFPQITMFNEVVGNNPLDQKFVWTAVTNHFPTPGWIGHVGGVSEITTSSPTSTEHYFADPDFTGVAGGLCQGLNGEFWFVDKDEYNKDSVSLFKGVYNSSSSDIDWAFYASQPLNHYTGYDSYKHSGTPNMAFSPDGNDGWVALIGDLVGGSDTTLNPIFMHSPDGGVTWGAPIEVDLRTVDLISDNPSIEEALKEGLYNDVLPFATLARPTCTNEFDITVDVNGNPHLFVVVASGNDEQFNTLDYEPRVKYTKLALDIYTEDGGVTWKAIKVAPVYTLDGGYGMPSPNDGSVLEIQNFCQISRSSDGSRVFYSWVDSDTTVIDFGESDNLTPDLRIAGLRVSDMFMTCPKWITRGDITWGGHIVCPTMAPEVLTTGNGSQFNLPIVFLEMISSKEDPCKFWYLGNDAIINESDFTGHVSWMDTDYCHDQLSVEEVGDVAIELYPNPFDDIIQLSVESGEYVLVDFSGRIVLSGSFEGGSIDLSSINNGFYLLQVNDTLLKIYKK